MYVAKDIFSFFYLNKKACVKKVKGNVSYSPSTDFTIKKETLMHSRDLLSAGASLIFIIAAVSFSSEFSLCSVPELC